MEKAVNVRRLRKKLMLTQPEMAARVGVTARTIYGWERREYEPQPRHARRLKALEAEAKGVSATVTSLAAFATDPGDVGPAPTVSGDEYARAEEVRFPAPAQSFGEVTHVTTPAGVLRLPRKRRRAKPASG